VANALALVARRPADRVGRLGGEEFAILLPDTDLEGAQKVAEHAVTSVFALQLPHVASLTAESVSISVGVAVCAGADVAAHDVQGLYSAADHALYAAKAQGRNRWVAELMGAT
jgi:diguanylate cyclase (GGDEF)-like protein